MMCGRSTTDAFTRWNAVKARDLGESVPVRIWIVLPEDEV
jgi:hypothetical protein